MRSVVVTGVSSGIGHEAAKLALERGVRVFGSVRRQRDADRLSAEWGDAFTPLLFDVRDEPAIVEAAARVREALGGETLGGLVNNVGVAIPGPLLLQPISEVREQIDTNLLGAMMVTKAFGPLLGADRSLRGPAGRIVNVTSIGGKLGQPFGTAYIATKHGLEGFSDSLRRELMPFAIEVSVVAPGVVNTPLWDKVERRLGRFEGTIYGDIFDRGIRFMVGAGRQHGQDPEEVAEAVWRALTAKRPKPRYAPAEHPVLEQGLLRVAPRRLIDWTMARILRVRRVRQPAE